MAPRAARAMINTCRDELRSDRFPFHRANIAGISIPTISFEITKRVSTDEIHFRRASELRLASRFITGFDGTAPLCPPGEIRSAIFANGARRMHMNGREQTYNRTHVVLGKGRRDWPVAGFPFVRDADRLRRFLLHRFRLVEQRQLVKLLDICNSPEKKEKTYYHLPRSSRRSEVKSPRTV